MSMPGRLGVLKNQDETGNVVTLQSCGLNEGGYTGIFPEAPESSIDLINTDYVGFWTLSENSGMEANDISENSLPMDYIGSPSLNGDIGTYFNGVNQCAKGTNCGIYDTTNSITIVAMIHPTHIGNRMSIVSKWSSDTDNRSWAVEIDVNGHLCFLASAGAGVAGSMCSIAVLEPNKTYKIIATFNSGTAKIYINGELDSTSTFTNTYIKNSTEFINIARRSDSTYYFEGYLRNISIYRYAWSAEQVAALPCIAVNNRNCSDTDVPPPQEDGSTYRNIIESLRSNAAVYHYTLDNLGSGNYSETNNNVTLNMLNIDEHDSDGIVNEATIFNGNSSYGKIDKDKLKSFAYSDNTMMCWVNIPYAPPSGGDNDSGAGLITRICSNGNYGTALSIVAPPWANFGKVAFATSITLNVDGTPQQKGTDSRNMSPEFQYNHWYFVVTVLDKTNGELRLYVDGSFIAKSTFDPNDDIWGCYSGSGDDLGWLIGISSPNNSERTWILDGKMDEITFVDRVLTSSEISSLWNSGKK